MASSRVYFDDRNRKEGGLLSIIVRHKGGMFTIPLNIHISAQQWDPSKQEVTRKHPQYRQYNNHIRSILANVEDVILELTREGILGGLTAKQLKRIFLERLQTIPDAVTVRDFSLSYIDNIKNERTKETYKVTLKKIDDYTGARDIYFTDITLDWLENFEAWMDKAGMSVNGKSFYLRTLRALFNRAIDRDVIDQNAYPFRKFRIKRESTPKRSLTVEELRMLRDYPCEEWQEKWRDMFMLIFYLIGNQYRGLDGSDRSTEGQSRVSSREDAPSLFHQSRTGSTSHHRQIQRDESPAGFRRQIRRPRRLPPTNECGLEKDRSAGMGG